MISVDLDEHVKFRKYSFCKGQLARFRQGKGLVFQCFYVLKFEKKNAVSLLEEFIIQKESCICVYIYVQLERNELAEQKDRER